MNRLVPHFILKQFAHGRYEGAISGSVLFVDISGFTAMTENLMKQSKEGAEILSNIINDLFNSMINSVYANEGFISTFAGDAFTAVFQNDRGGRALQSAKSIVDLFKKRKSIATKYGDFELFCRVGISEGIIDWKIIGNNSKSFYFKGSPVGEAALCEKHSPLNGILSTSQYCALSNVKYTKHNYGYCFVNSDDIAVLPDNIIDIDFADDMQKSFYSPAILHNSVRGEFRDVFSVFCAFQDNNEHLIADLLKVSEKGGFVDLIDFGDKGSIMFFLFGAPISYKDEEKRAVDFLFGITDKYKQNVKFSITHGALFAGFVGNDFRSTYTVLGDSVNLSARILDKTDWGDVWCDSSALKALGNLIELKSKYSFAFKGKNEITEVYGIKAVSKEYISSAFDKMIGRSKEINSLLFEIEDSSRKGKPLVLCISGESGSGKSLLLNEASKILTQDHTVILSNADQILKESFNPFKSIVRTLLDIDENDNPDNSIKKVKNFTKMIFTLHSDYFTIDENLCNSLILDFLDIDASTSVLSRMNPKDRYDNLMYSLMLAFNLFEIKKPYILCIDDSQYIDFDSLNFIDYLIRNVNDSHIKFILIMRNKSDVDLKDSSSTARSDIELFRFDAHKAKLLISELLGKSIDDDSFKGIFERTEGNPYFIKQILFFLKEKNLLIDNSSHYSISENEEKIPMTLNSLLLSRIDALEIPLKNILCSASIIGNSIKLEFLNMIFSSGDLYETIDSAIAEGLFEYSKTDTIKFVQPMMRDVAYEMQLKETVRKAHREFADSLKSKYLKFPEYFHITGLHYEKAERTAEAKYFYLKSVKYVKSKYRNQETISLYEKLIEFSSNTVEKTKFKLLLAEIYYNISIWHKSEDIYIQLLDEYSKSDDKAQLIEIMNDISNLYRIMSRYDEALDVSQRAIELASSSDMERNAMHSLSVQSIIYMTRGDMAKSFEILEHQVEILKSSVTSDRESSMVYSNLSNYYWALADYSKALEYANLSMSFTKISDKSGIASCLSNIGGIYWYLGDLKKCKKNYLKGIKLAKASGSKHIQSIITGNIANIFLTEGNLHKALDYSFDKIKMAQEMKDMKGLAFANLNIGSIYLMDRNTDKAEDFFQKALDQCREFHLAYFESIVLGNIGEMRLFEGRYDEALDYFMKKLDIADKSKNEKTIATTYSSLGDLFYAMEDYEQAEDSFCRAEEFFEKLNISGNISYALEQRGLVRMMKGLYDEARDFLSKADLVLTDRTHRVKIARIYLETADVEEKSGNIIKALEVIKKAYDMIPKIADKVIVFEIKIKFARICFLNGDKKQVKALLKLIGKAPSELLWNIYAVLYELTSDSSYKDSALIKLEEEYALTKFIRYKKEIEAIRNL